MLSTIVGILPYTEQGYQFIRIDMPVVQAVLKVGLCLLFQDHAELGVGVDVHI